MSRTVRMHYHISGGRADGTDWPAAGELLECDDTEAAGLVAGRLADWADNGPARSWDPDAGVEKRDGAPPARANRDAWAAHAVAQGADEAAVAEMTKAQLIEQFGAAQ